MLLSFWGVCFFFAKKSELKARCMCGIWNIIIIVKLKSLSFRWIPHNYATIRLRIASTNVNKISTAVLANGASVARSPLPVEFALNETTTGTVQ